MSEVSLTALVTEAFLTVAGSIEKDVGPVVWRVAPVAFGTAPPAPVRG